MVLDPVLQVIEKPQLFLDATACGFGDMDENTLVFVTDHTVIRISGF